VKGHDHFSTVTHDTFQRISIVLAQQCGDIDQPVSALKPMHLRQLRERKSANSNEMGIGISLDK